MTTAMKYNLKQINEISQNGFNFKIPDDTIVLINYLCSQVGSSGITSDVFTSENKTTSYSSYSINGNNNNSINGNNNNGNSNKKRRGNKGLEVTNDEWETFQTTKIEQKLGIDGEIDQIRLYLNKLTDKTFLDLREKIITKINIICDNMPEQENIEKLGLMLYETSSTNKFYSKIFADVFAELATNYGWLKTIFEQKYGCIMDLYTNIQYVDSDKDFDGFCEMNKANEKRRAITTFYMNLAINGFIYKDNMVNVLKNILTMIMNMINIPGKKNEVDELTEIVGILFNVDVLKYVNLEQEEYQVLGNSIINVVNNLANQKSKDYPSLSNKAIFKYMDLIEL